MNEQQLEERMLASVADEPPLGFDPDELVDRAGRRRNRRRTVLGATVAAAALMVTAIAIGTGSDRDQFRAADEPNHVPTKSYCPGKLAEAAPRLIAKHLPDVEFSSLLACTVADNLYQVASADQRVWVYRNANRTGGDFFATKTDYDLVGVRPSGDALIRIYRYGPDATGESVLAATRLGPGNMILWAMVSGKGRLVASEEQLVAMVSDPTLRF